MRAPTRISNRRQLVAAALVTGVTSWVWYAEFAASGDEVWDRAEYWTIGLPLFFATVLGAQILAPVSIFGWPILVAVTQAVVMTITQGLGAFFLVGLGFLAVLAVPNILAASIGSAIARRMRSAA